MSEAELFEISGGALSVDGALATANQWAFGGVFALTFEAFLEGAGYGATLGPIGAIVGGVIGGTIGYIVSEVVLPNGGG